MHYRNVIFDLYGTLVDIRTDETLPALWSAMADWYRNHGAVCDAVELCEGYHTFVAREQARVRQALPGIAEIDIEIGNVFEALFREKGVRADNCLIAETALRFRRLSTLRLRLYEGVTELLDALRGQGRRIFLLTNAQRLFTMPELQALGLADRFDGISISSDSRICKPEAAFFRTVLDRYDLDPRRTLMVGNDGYADIGGARAVGLDGLYIHQAISPEVPADMDAVYRVMDGDVRKAAAWILAH